MGLFAAVQADIEAIALPYLQSYLPEGAAHHVYKKSKPRTDDDRRDLALALGAKLGDKQRMDPDSFKSAWRRVVDDRNCIAHSVNIAPMWDRDRQEYCFREDRDRAPSNRILYASEVRERIDDCKNLWGYVRSLATTLGAWASSSSPSSG